MASEFPPEDFTIPYSKPVSEDFASLQESYTGVHPDKKPKVVVLPETPEQLQHTVQQALSRDLPIVVRGGGHDSFGRWSVADAVLVDLRNLNKVTVCRETQTARVQGGTKILQLLQVLKDHGFQTATGACGTVGYVGWALPGGFGPFQHSYGLGADQIVGATVVNAKGELIDANERLLKGLRGGGGSLAIVAELVVKIYPLQQIQAGIVPYESSNLKQTISTLFTNLAALTDRHDGRLPSKLGIHPGVLPLPGMPGGLGAACIIIWNGSPDDESKEWIERIANLAPTMPGSPEVDDAIKPTTAFDFFTFLNPMLPYGVTGKCHTASIKAFTPESIANLAEVATKIPAGFAGGLNMHILRADSPTCSDDVPPSVLPWRQPHIMLELLGFGQDEESSKAAAQWALDARNVFVNSKDACDGTYVPLTATDLFDLEKTYGDKLPELMELKTEFDPDGVFQHTVPKLI